MSDFKNRFDSYRQQWSTPRLLFDQLDAEFHFQTDLAANSANAKCTKYFDEESNGLIQRWTGRCWLNPPYGDTKHRLVDWIKKAHISSLDEGTTVVMLVPARTNTRWWHEHCMKAAEVRFICGRPKFGDADHGLPLPLAIVVFAKHDCPTKYSSLFLV